MQCILESANHLQWVSKEQNHYKKCIQKCREALPARLANTSPICRRPLSYRGEMHYSFDYAQQIHLPHNSQQVGPIYFFTGYKVGLFGVSIEPINHFVLYVIPEACAVGKGSSSVISFLYRCFMNFSFGATKLSLHTDNCCGQNKNKFVLQFCEWLVMMGYFESVEIAFLIVGHTKFDVDTWFGNFKWKWIQSRADQLKHVCRIAAQTKNTSVVLVGDEQGNAYVPQYDWSEFFEGGDTDVVKNIKQYHHFRAEVERPGIIVHRLNIDAPEESTSIYRDTYKFDMTKFPKVFQPPGLPATRQKYLFKKIRPYVKKASKNILCPRPSSLTKK